MSNKYNYGKTSILRLKTVNPILKLVFLNVLRAGLIDVSILEGERSKERQNQFFKEGKSEKKWPEGKHNIEEEEQYSEALDASPFVSGKASFDHKHCCFLAGIVQATAKNMNVQIRWGGNWDMDGEPITDQDFQDLVHYEIIL